MLNYKIDDLENHRFFCSCMVPDHILEVDLSKDIDGHILSACISFWPPSRTGISLWKRIKFSFFYLFGFNTGTCYEFYLEDKDRKELVELLGGK